MGGGYYNHYQFKNLINYLYSKEFVLNIFKIIIFVLILVGLLTFTAYFILLSFEII